MIELVKHLGLVPENDPRLVTSIYKLKGLIICYILINAIIVYLMVSVTCSLLCFTFADASVNMKRKACSIFWDLCIYFVQLNGVQFNITGDAITSESAIFISNHQSLVDHIAVNFLSRYTYFVNHDLEVPIVNFFTWFLIWKVPTLKILLNIAKNDENWELDASLNEVFFQKLIKSKKVEWLVVFPEVNIFTPESASLQRIQSKKYYLPSFRNLLYPRFSSFYNVITMTKNKNIKFNKLYDLTIYYYRLDESGNKLSFSPTILDIFGSQTKAYINIDVKCKSLSRVPHNRKKLEKWLEKEWIEKDQLVDTAYSM